MDIFFQIWQDVSFENDFLDEMERLKKEIDLLENEKENMVGPNQLISECLSSRWNKCEYKI